MSQNIFLTYRDHSSMHQPLKGLKVLALEQAVAAPFATARMADAGAEVIKIERPEGDFARGYDQAAKGLSSYFVWLNRGKKTLILDLKQENDRKKLDQELKTTDNFVQNLRYGVISKFGFNLERLHQVNPRLISCSLNGFSQKGPMADRKAYDLLIQAETGLASITGSAQDAARVGISIVDIATGSTAYSACLEALVQRGISGKGSKIEVSLFDVMAEWLTVPLLNHEAGNTPHRIGLAHPSIAPYGVFSTKVGPDILIAIQSEREWFNFCDLVLFNKSIASQRKFSSNIARVANRAETDRLVANVLCKLTSEEAIDKLKKADIAFALLNDMEGLSKHPCLRRINIQTEKGPVSIPAPPAIFNNTEPCLGSVPSLKNWK